MTDSSLDAEPLVKVAGLTKHYRKTQALDGVNLSIPLGGFFGVIGPDGAGKSTLLKILAGVLQYEQGNVSIFGHSIATNKAAEQIKPRLGFMPQGLGLNLYPTLSVDENIEFFARIRGVKGEVLTQRKQQLLALTRLAKFRKRSMGKLSGGMKQKLGLICTLIHNPELLILDEPTTGVDPVSRRDFWSILTELLKSQTLTVIVATAYMDEASRFHHLALMDQSKVLFQGDLDQVLHQAAVKPNQVKHGQPPLELAFSRLTGQQDQVTFHWPISNTERNNHFDTAIHADNLNKYFGDFCAVNAVNLHVPKGRIFGLLGANGAGKTTVIKMLTGLLKASSGKAAIAGINIKRSRRIRQNIGYMSQAFSLYQDLKVLENVQLYGGIYGLRGRYLAERVNWVLAVSELNRHQQVMTTELPMGLRQRLALGCALIHEPSVLFLDEPTSGVDPQGRERFWQLLRHLVDTQGVTILITTHYMTEAEYCDQVALMHAGRVIADASPSQLKQQLTEEAGKLLLLTPSQPMEALALLEHQVTTNVALYGRDLHIFAGKQEAALRQQLAAVFQDHQITMKPPVEVEPSMEDVFVYRMLQEERLQA